MLPTFYGNLNENLYKNLKDFIRVCDVIQGADDELRQTLFPFSLNNKKSKNTLTTLVEIQDEVFRNIILEAKPMQ